MSSELVPESWWLCQIMPSVAVYHAVYVSVCRHWDVHFDTLSPLRSCLSVGDTVEADAQSCWFMCVCHWSVKFAVMDNAAVANQFTQSPTVVKATSLLVLLSPTVCVSHLCSCLLWQKSLNYICIYSREMLSHLCNDRHTGFLKTTIGTLCSLRSLSLPGMPGQRKC